MGGRIGYLVAVLSSTACIVTPMRVLLHTEGNPLGKLCAEECSSGVDEVRRLLARRREQLKKPLHPRLLEFVERSLQLKFRACVGECPGAFTQEGECAVRLPSPVLCMPYTRTEMSGAGKVALGILGVAAVVGSVFLGKPGNAGRAVAKGATRALAKGATRALAKGAATAAGRAVKHGLARVARKVARLAIDQALVAKQAPIGGPALASLWAWRGRLEALNQDGETAQVAARQSAKPSTSAAYVLYAFRGAQDAGWKVQRTRGEARAKAADALVRLRAGANFAALAEAESDCATRTRGGSLGVVEQGGLHKTLDEALFLLQPGAISEVVEAPFGFAIIHRGRRRQPGGRFPKAQFAGPPSSAARIFAASSSLGNGFWMKFTPSSSTPCRAMTSAV